MALQNKNTFQKSGTCRKNLEVRQDCDLSFIITIIIFHWVIWSGENNMTLEVATPICVIYSWWEIGSTAKARDENNRFMLAGRSVLISSNVPLPRSGRIY